MSSEVYREQSTVTSYQIVPCEVNTGKQWGVANKKLTKKNLFLLLIRVSPVK